MLDDVTKKRINTLRQILVGKLPEDLRNKIPTYIRENINLERFINA